MPDYKLTPDAEADLLQIAIYTIETWGIEQAGRYEAAIVDCLAAIAHGTARSKRPMPHRPELLVTRCQHHLVFWLQEENTAPLIVAVLHEKMDLLQRLRDRLE